MKSPLPSALICLGYVVFVFVGPQMMKDRKPYDLKYPIILYNLCTFLISGYLFYEVNQLFFLLKSFKFIKQIKLVFGEWMVE